MVVIWATVDPGVHSAGPYEIMVRPSGPQRVVSDGSTGSPAKTSTESLDRTFLPRIRASVGVKKAYDIRYR